MARENDLKLPHLRDQILTRFVNRRSRDLHFRHLNHAQKVVACQEVAKFPVGLCVAFSHKVTIPSTSFEAAFKKKGYLYNYILRWVLERVTAHCARLKPDCSLKIIFSRRANTDYQAMVNYLELMRDGREVMQPARSINWKVLNVADIVVENHSKWAGLQIADCMTSAFFSAVEPNVYGNCEQTYAAILRDKLITDQNGNVLNCGLTPIPSLWKCKPDAAQRAFFEAHIKNEQAPGP